MRTICLITLLFVAGCDSSPPGDGAPTPGAVEQQVDWPIYRGNVQMQGVAVGKLADRFELAWQYQTEGPILSSAVVVDGTVFVGSGDSHVHALNLSDGSLKWKRQLGNDENLADVEAPPMVHDGVVYIGSTNNTFYALDADTGEPRWTFIARDQITGSATPAKLKDGRTVVLIGSYDGSMYCLDSKNGEQVWAFATQDFINGAPAVHQTLRLVVFGGCDGKVYSIDLDTGQQESAIDIKHPNAGTTALLGRTAYLGHHGNAYVAGGIESGKIEWEYKPNRRFAFFSAAAVTDDVIVFGGRDRNLHAAKIVDGQPLWQFTTGGKVDSSPVIVGDRVIVGSHDGKLYVIDLKAGTEVWAYEVGRAISASPAVAMGHIVIGSEDGSVYAFKPQSQTQDKGGS